jgi:hypothetical protein
MQRRKADIASGLRLAVGPGHLVVQAEHLNHPLAEKFAVVGPLAEAPHIHAPQVEAGLAVDDPLGQRYFPAPPALAIPTELKPQATNSPFSSGVSPMRKLLSGVKLSGPFTNFWKPVVSSAGMRCFPWRNGSANFSQSGSSNWNENLSGTRSTIQGFDSAWKAPSITASPSPRK